MSDELESLQRELRGVQEMLAFVLSEVGPVRVPKVKLREGLSSGLQITINDDLENDTFVFNLEPVE